MAKLAVLSSSETPSSCLYERKSHKNNAARVVELIILVLLVSLLVYRLLSIKNHGSIWLVALVCESWFTFIWVLVVSTKWNPMDFKTYPHRLFQQVKELPAVDMFVTTADPSLEPPILTVNTVLSLLAVEYPGASHRLACYVSDDSCSPLTFFALTEASKFAQKWVPFCKKYKVEVRAPFRYFTAKRPSSLPSGVHSLEFQGAWQQIKEEYDQLCKTIENASKSSLPCNLSGDFAAFSNVDGRDHPSIVKIIWENKDGNPDGVPHLIYIAREKRLNHHHHYKAGAMNALMRVSGLLTNAPYMLNVDCDMYANNPQIVLHAMCIFLDPNSENDIAYVQCPQQFYDGLKDDPFGNQLVAIFHYMARGIAGIQGTFYVGTGCFHRRKVLYGAWPDSLDEKDKVEESKRFGRSEEFCRSAALAMKGQSHPHKDLSSSLEAAHQVASCSYDSSTLWGKEVGIRYGSATEDILTGISIHAKGWNSAYCYTLNPRPFLGCAPTGGPSSLTQQKRWSTGLLEVLVSKNSPIVTVPFGHLKLRQGMAYMWLLLWNLRSVPELVYTLLPPYCIVTNSTFLPGSHDRAALLYTALITVYAAYNLFEYLFIGLSVRTWWNNQRMARITSTCAWTFGSLSIVPKILGVSKITVFEVTKKDQTTTLLSGDGDEGGGDEGRFTFDESPVFVPGTTVLLIQLAALAVAALGLQPPQTPRGGGSGFGEVACGLYLVLCFWPFVRGLVGRGKYGIPLATIFKSAAMATVFVHLCRFSAS